MELSCATLCVASLPFRHALDSIARGGFTLVDLAIVPGYVDHVDLAEGRTSNDVAEDIAAAVSARGLRVGSVVTYLRLPDSLDDGQELERRANRVETIVTTTGAARWVIDAGASGGHAADRAAALRRWASFVAVVGPLAERTGVQLLVEAPHRGTLAESAEQVQELLDVADGVELGVNLDTFHAADSSGSLAHALDLLLPRIGLVSLGDRWNGSSVRPGSGSLRLAECVRTLKDGGFSGPVSVEYADAGDGGRDLAAARHAVEALLQG